MTTQTLFNYKYYLGVDVSKLTLDVVLINDAEKIMYQSQIQNNSDSWAILQSILTKHEIPIEQLLICGEHTGMYTYHMMSWVAQGAHVWVESGKRIKNSQGIIRGKNDAKDAHRIALYAQSHAKKANLWQPLSETIEDLRNLTALRERLVLALNTLVVPLNEQKNFMPTKQYQLVEQMANPALESIKEQIKTVESKIKETIQKDDNLKKQLEVLDSIPGIATKTAIGLIIKTKGFTAFKNARQFACQGGIAPFGFQSGTSRKASDKVSHHADKEIKSMLHLAALAATKTNSSIRDYYIRKVNEGKSKMSVINAIRNKIAHIAFALVKKSQLFDNNFTFSFDLS
jgi:transposase